TTLPIWGRSVTSSGRSTTRGSLVSSVSLSGFRIVAITVQPFDEKSLAAARPSPDELPVMKTVRPFSLLIASFLHPPGQRLQSHRNHRPSTATQRRLPPLRISHFAPWAFASHSRLLKWVCCSPLPRTTAFRSNPAQRRSRVCLW